MIRKSAFVLFVVFCTANVVYSQGFSQAPPRSNYGEEISWQKTTVVGVGTVGLLYVVHQNYTKELWWPTRGPFHFEYDSRYAKSVDKPGHTFASYFVGDRYRGMYLWSGFDDRTARWLAFGSVNLIQGFTEYHEGLSRYFGFDLGDYISGAGVGGGLLVLQGYFPMLDRVSLKWSFVPRKNPAYDRMNPWMKDYQDQTYWVSTDVYKGYSVALGANLTDWRDGKGDLQLWLSPDFDWRSLDRDSEILRILNAIKLPTPAVRIYPSPRLVFVSWIN
ncbi:MAG: hypothetical protein AAB631_00010 [Patescibacteria group bacterium]